MFHFDFERLSRQVEPFILSSFRVACFQMATGLSMQDLCINLDLDLKMIWTHSISLQKSPMLITFLDRCYCCLDHFQLSLEFLHLGYSPWRIKWSVDIYQPVFFFQFEVYDCKTNLFFLLYLKTKLQNYNLNKMMVDWKYKIFKMEYVQWIFKMLKCKKMRKNICTAMYANWNAEKDRKWKNLTRQTIFF